jgi:hypothetical protein
MAAIPFSLIGILPAHCRVRRVLHRHLDDWFHGRRRDRGAQFDHPGGFHRVAPSPRAERVRDAVVEAGAVRFRPMLLTALAVVVGASVILADPIFQGLAISLMFGEIASLLVSRMAVPVLYFMTNPQPPA